VIESQIACGVALMNTVEDLRGHTPVSSSSSYRFGLLFRLEGDADTRRSVPGILERTPVSTNQDLPVLSFASPAEWQEWLEANHATSSGLRLRLAKKGSGIASISYAEAVEVALCYGWIDGRANRLDDDYWLQRFTPRTPRSKWSKLNRAKATALIERGEMKAAGLREVERARTDGRWDAAYDASSTATVPEDLRAELEKNDRAREFFEALDSRNRYAILYQIQDAKRPETRGRRIAKYVTMLGEQKRLYP
jgi:uncharacterized protein YdeI (YjbR/CyaY-like superfamily)